MSLVTRVETPRKPLRIVGTAGATVGVALGRQAGLTAIFTGGAAGATTVGFVLGGQAGLTTFRAARAANVGGVTIAATVGVARAAIIGGAGVATESLIS